MQVYLVKVIGDVRYSSIATFVDVAFTSLEAAQAYAAKMNSEVEKHMKAEDGTAYSHSYPCYYASLRPIEVIDQ